MTYLLIFIGSGFLGWILDTAYRTFYDKRFSTGTFFPFFSVAYATASVLLYCLFVFWPASILFHILVGTLLSVVIEFLGGNIALYIFKRRLWDYRNNRWNYLGFIDITHSFYWFLLTTLYRFIVLFLF